MSDSTITTRDMIIDSIKALPVADMWAVMESALKALKTASKPSKVKKVRDPDAPKKEATWWVKRTCEVREALKDVIASENASRKSRGENALPAVAAVRVTSMLRDTGKLSQDGMPSQEDMLATWTTFLTSPPEPKPKPVKKDGSKSSEAKSSNVTKTTKKTETKSEPTPTLMKELFGDDETEPETEVAPYEWAFDFGKGEKLYERLDYEGKAYIYDNDSKAYLGLFMDKLKKLNKSVADPLA